MWLNMCRTESCIASDRPSKLNVVPVHKIMNSLSRAAKMMRNIIQGYSRKNTWEGGGDGSRYIFLWVVSADIFGLALTLSPALSLPIAWFLWIDLQKDVPSLYARVSYQQMNLLLSVLSCKYFLVGLKPVSEPPVPENVQSKGHVFRALMLE